jgi:pimeloyl-ACP methyl ester carboxylesterase
VLQLERIIYFHGVPGGAEELRLFGRKVAESTERFHLPDRQMAQGNSCEADYFRALADGLRQRFPNAPLRFVGFSLGASVALRTAPHLGDHVCQIDLVSAAAPLDLADYLPKMAGAPVFRLAKHSSHLFRLLTAVQSVAARIVPEQLYDMLFASSQGMDREQINDPLFRATMLGILKSCFAAGLPSYRGDIAAYVDDWAGELGAVTQPVSLWHGCADNWSPVAMANDLARRLPRCIGVNLFNGLSHYSMLGRFLTNHSAE